MTLIRIQLQSGDGIVTPEHIPDLEGGHPHQIEFPPPRMRHAGPQRRLLQQQLLHPRLGLAKGPRLSVEETERHGEVT